MVLSPSRALTAPCPDPLLPFCSPASCGEPDTTEQRATRISRGSLPPSRTMAVVPARETSSLVPPRTAFAFFKAVLNR